MKLMSLLILITALTMPLATADGFGYTYSSITGSGNDVVILIDWTPTMIDPLCAPRPCCYNEIPADCCHYVVFYANSSGVYYLGYVYSPAAFSSENGTYLLIGNAVYRAHNGCFQRLGGVTGKAKLVFPYLAARTADKLSIYHLGSNMSRIGSIKMAPECTFDMGSRNLIVSCPNGTERFNLTPSGLFEVSSIDRWEFMESKRPSMAEGKLENGTLVFSNGSRVYRISADEFLPYLYDRRELELLVGVFMKDYLLILPPVMDYAYCVENGTFGSSLGISSFISGSGFVLYDIKPGEFRPVYAFIYRGTLKPAPLFLPTGSYFRPLAMNVTIRKSCPCPPEAEKPPHTETSSKETDSTITASAETDNRICGPGMVVLLILPVLFMRKR